MGSSDPLPAGFKIRFGSLNFHATGNGYLMRITNRVELHPWRSTWPGPIPATPAGGAPALAPPGAAGPSAPRRHRRSGQCSHRARAERRRAARAAAQHDEPLGATTPAEGFPHGICNAATAYTSSAGTDIVAYDDLPGYHLLVPEGSSPRTMSRTMAPTASYRPRLRMGTRNGISPACQIQ
jgi:hypothetical protein